MRRARICGKKFGERVFGIPGDLTDTSVIDAALTTVNRMWGGPDILIANVGSGRASSAGNKSRQDWDRLFNLNFFGSVRLAQAAIPYLQPRGGSILFIGSIVALEATAAPLPYQRCEGRARQLQQESVAHCSAIRNSSKLPRSGKRARSQEAPGNDISRNDVRKLSAISRPRCRRSDLARLRRSRGLRRISFPRIQALPLGDATSWMAGRHGESNGKECFHDQCKRNRLATLFDLHDRVAIVTGGAGLLGYHHGAILASAGAHVVLLDLPERESARLGPGS